MRLSVPSRGPAAHAGLRARGISAGKNYVGEQGRRRRERFMPLTHAPGNAQPDFGDARVVIGGVEQKVHFVALHFPCSDASVVRAYPAAVSEARVDGHLPAFAVFGRVPQDSEEDQESIRWIKPLTNRCLVAKILPGYVPLEPGPAPGFCAR